MTLDIAVYSVIFQGNRFPRPVRRGGLSVNGRREERLWPRKRAQEPQRRNDYRRIGRDHRLRCRAIWAMGKATNTPETCRQATFHPDELRGTRFYKPTEFGFEKDVGKRMTWWAEVKARSIRAAGDDTIAK